MTAGVAGLVGAEERGHPVEDLVQDLGAGVARHDLGDLRVRRGLDELSELLGADRGERLGVEISHRLTFQAARYLLVSNLSDNAASPCSLPLPNNRWTVGPRVPNSQHVFGSAAGRAQAALRALAHPLRLRIMSLLTGAPLTAAEVARELGISHANASYHLRNLLSGGLIVLAGEEKIRGGVAKRYRYDAHLDWDAPSGPAGRTTSSAPTTSPSPTSSSAVPPSRDCFGPGQLLADGDLWVEPATWHDIRSGSPRWSATCTTRPGRPAPPAPYAPAPPSRCSRCGRRETMNAVAPLRHPAFRLPAHRPHGQRPRQHVRPIALAFAVLDLTGSASDLGLVVGRVRWSTSCSCSSAGCSPTGCPSTC